MSRNLSVALLTVNAPVTLETFQAFIKLNAEAPQIRNRWIVKRMIAMLMFVFNYAWIICPSKQKNQNKKTGERRSRGPRAPRRRHPPHRHRGANLPRKTWRSRCATHGGTTHGGATRGATTAEEPCTPFRRKPGDSDATAAQPRGSSSAGTTWGHCRTKVLVRQIVLKFSSTISYNSRHRRAGKRMERRFGWM